MTAQVPDPGMAEEKSYGETYWGSFNVAPLVRYAQLTDDYRGRIERGAQAVAARVRSERGTTSRGGVVPVRFVDRRCGHKTCEGRGAYRMIGGCYNCRAEPLLGLFTVTHEARGGDCPVCGCRALHWDRLAAADEIPADFEGAPDDGRHPDGCACQFCREDEREQRAREDADSAEDDDFAADAASLDDLEPM